MATHSITIERFVRHKTAGWQGVVLAGRGLRGRRETARFHQIYGMGIDTVAGRRTGDNHIY